MQLVPELMVEVFYVAQVREQLAHYAEDGTHALVTFFADFECECIFNHSLNISSVLGNDKVWAVAVIRLKIQLIVDCLLHVN